MPMAKLHNSAWKSVGLPVKDGVLKGVHNLRHTFGRRLRAAEVAELRDACERIANHDIAQTPTLTLVRNTSVGNM